MLVKRFKRKCSLVCNLNLLKDTLSNYLQIDLKISNEKLMCQWTFLFVLLPPFPPPFSFECKYCISNLSELCEYKYRITNLSYQQTNIGKQLDMLDFYIC